METRAEASPVGAFRRAFGSLWLTTLMLGAIALVMGIAVSSAARDRADSLDDYSGRQALLASAIGVDFEHRLVARHAETPAGLTDDALIDLLGGAQRIEHAGNLIVLLARPNATGFLTTDRRIIPSERLRAALDSGRSSVVLSRDEAAGFGLPRRTAIGGLAHVRTPELGEWGVVVLATAQRMRDRQILEERRLAATGLAVTLIALVFGILAHRRQKLELEREREAVLARADKMATLAALSTGIAHEVGTPLGVIVGRVEQALERTEDPRAASALRVVLDQVDRIRRIVRGCLALARGDAPERVATAPRSLAERATDLVRHRFANAGVTLECVVVQGLPTIACDTALFEQALVNVLLNACEATPRGGTVRLSVPARTSDGDVRFVVEDEGPGISDATRARALEPFFSTRRREGGTGLGLTIAREIVDHHGGVLVVERRDEGGTRATISIAA